MNILLVINSKYVKCGINMLRSLMESNDEKIRVFLAYRDLKEEEIEDVRKCLGDNELELLYIDKDKLNGLKDNDRLPLETYFRIIALDMLPENVNKVLYLDADMIVKKSLKDLYNINIDKLSAIACKDIYGYIYGVGNKSEERLGLKNKGRYFNAGMMLFNIKYCREHNICQKTIDFIKEYSDIIIWQDQDALNVILEESVGLVQWEMFNCTPCMYVCKKSDIEQGIVQPIKADETTQVNEHISDYVDMTMAIYDNASIIHYIGETKPWDSKRPDSYCYGIFDKAYNMYK
jgi:lipopolysaccharide biosynthesis glycosyltransferase